jgi:hypothetical protein
VTAEEMLTGLSVEFGDELSGGGEHDRVESCHSVGDPSGEGILRGGGEVASNAGPARKASAPGSHMPWSHRWGTLATVYEYPPGLVSSRGENTGESKEAPGHPGQWDSRDHDREQAPASP